MVTEYQWYPSFYVNYLTILVMNQILLLAKIWLFCRSFNRPILLTMDGDLSLSLTISWISVQFFVHHTDYYNVFSSQQR